MHRGHRGKHQATSAKGDPYRWRLVGLTAMFFLTIPATLVVTLGMDPGRGPSRFDDWAVTLGVPAMALERGEATYRATCAVCHGADGQGIARLGKPLRNSEFVQSQSDAALLNLLVKGRDVNDPLNTTRSPMPARAGDMTMPAFRLADVVSYLRTLQEPGAAHASMDAWIVPSTALEGVQISGAGHEAYIASCSACHGVKGEGVEAGGLPLRGSEFVKSKTHEELVAFVKRGRASWDMDNKTGVDMPPKGGNPALSDDALAKIVEFIKSMEGNVGS